MKPHSEGFKEQITQMGRQLRGVISYGNTTLEEEIRAITPHYEANLLKSVMKQLDLELSVDIPLETVINCQIGIMVNDNYEMLNYGNYVVYSSEKQEDTDTYKIVCYDKMLYAMKQNEDLGVTYPISIKAYLTALANKIGLTVENSSFNNQNLQIPSELYVGQEYTYRDILDEIAQATGSVICINDNDKLEVRYPNNLGAEVTATGKNITITEHEDNKISGLKIYGNSEQDGTPTPENPQEIHSTGDNVNLFNSDIEANAWNNDNGTGTVWSNQYVRSKDFVACNPNTTYTINFEVTGTDAKRGNALLYDSNKTFIKSINISDNRTFTTTAETKYLKFNFYNASGITVNDLKNVKLEKGTVATPYTPYEMGSVNEKVQNKNLLNIQGIVKGRLDNGQIGYVDNVDSLILNDNSFSFTTNANWRGVTSDFISVNVSGTTSMRINYNNLNSEFNLTPACYDKNKIWIGNGTVSGIANEKVRTISLLSGTEYVRIYFHLATAGSITISNPMLEQGTNASDYVAHEEQNISIPCQQPMRAIGEYKDTFIKVDGNWYERHYISELDLSDVTFRMPASNSENAVFTNLLNTNICNYKLDTLPFLSEYFIWKGRVNGYAEALKDGIGLYSFISGGYKYLYFVVPLNIASNVTEFTEWVANNNVEVIYVLATPADLPCTEEQVEVLNSLSYLTLYDGVTHINSDANIEFRYVAEYETIDEEFLKDVNVDFAQKYGPINSIVLSRAAESDNVYLRNERSVQEDGLCEIKIVDNQIMNFNNRSDFLQGILDALDGLEYYINDFNSPGILYLSLLDRYSIQVGENKYKSIMLNDEVNVTTGIEEIIHTDMPEQSETDYEKADKTDRRINQTYLIVDKQNQTIESVVSNVSEQNNKISQITQTVDEINSKLQDIADITTYGESDRGVVELQGINQSEPIMIKVHPTAVNISYLYPRSNLYPSNSLYMTTRTIRFIRTYEEEGVTKTQNIDYELPDDLLRYSNEVYDEFYLDYDSQTCQIIKRCGYNADGTVSQLANETTIDYPYPEILLNDGDYEIQLLGYDYGYLYVRLMAQNIYTTQFATKAEVTSSINQKANEINLRVEEKLDGEDFTGANIILAINNDTSYSSINADKIDLYGKEIDLTADNVSISSNNFRVDEMGNMSCANAKITGGNFDMIGDESTPTIRITDYMNDEIEIYPSNINMVWKYPVNNHTIEFYVQKQRSIFKI